RFGWATTTYDRAGDAVGERTEVALAAERLEPLLEQFRGEVMQTPPLVSAKKIDGKRGYELARKSVVVELEPVAVQVYELTLLGVEGSDARVRAHCSGGT